MHCCLSSDFQDAFVTGIIWVALFRLADQLVLQFLKEHNRDTSVTILKIIYIHSATFYTTLVLAVLGFVARAVVPKKISQNLGKILSTCKPVDLNSILDPVADLCLRVSELCKIGLNVVTIEI